MKRVQRKADGEDAARARHVPHRQRALVRLDGLAGDGESESQTRSAVVVRPERERRAVPEEDWSEVFIGQPGSDQREQGRVIYLA